MKKKPLAVTKFRVQNFKAIRDSGWVEFTPLTIFIGNNGVGKSSLVESMETLQDIVDMGLDKAMKQWSGFEFIWNQAVPHNIIETDGISYQENPMKFCIQGNISRYATYQFDATSEITAKENNNSIFFLEENMILEYPENSEGRREIKREIGKSPTEAFGKNDPMHKPIFGGPNSDESVFIAASALGHLGQFIRFNPDIMMKPYLMRNIVGYLPLSPDGSNIAEYLLDIQSKDPNVIESIVETLKTILPYVNNIQPIITTEIGRTAYLQMTEAGFKLPGWLFSTGTLRLVALLAVFRHPEPPPLIIIEEIENGLDPRSIHVILEEIRYLVSSGKSQVILTTHSPYLLDLVPLESIIFVERNADGEPKFFRPAEEENVQKWSDNFAPGRLYTMGRFRHKA
jgi:predicted ATPase